MRPFVTDAVIVREGRIVLIKRGKEPWKGMWALPGGFAEEGETAEQCCEREALEETGLRVRAKKLVGVFSSLKRDPRGTIAGAYICELIGGELKGGDDAKEAKWFSLEELPELAFDHKKIIEEAKKLMR
ncbi:NUDIX hydrolase [Candidatus Micrarchaeota archaeon]|nr:NUDIX hydrolase [Candidatus Micrarchaeota archaeon]